MSLHAVIQPLDAQSIAGAPDRWRWRDSGGKTGSGSALELGHALATADQVTLLVPGEWVLVTEVELPTRNPARVRQALPYALEEHLVQPAEDLHCVAGEFVGDSLRVAAVVSPQLLQPLLDALDAVEISADCAVPDTLCIPWEPGQVTRLIDGDRILLRWGPGAVSVTDRDSENQWLQMVAEADGQAAQSIRSPDGDAFDVLSLHAQDADLNLLQGEFAAGDESPGWRSARWPAGLAAAALLLSLGLQYAEAWRLQQQSDQLAATIEEQFRSTFPEVRRMQADPAPQIEMALRELRAAGGSGNEMLQLLQRVAPELAAANGVSLRQLRYRGGRLDLELAAGRIDQLDTLRTRLESTGLNASLGATRVDGDRVSGSVSVAAAGGAGG